MRVREVLKLLKEARPPLLPTFDEEQLGTVIEFLEHSTALAVGGTEDVSKGGPPTASRPQPVAAPRT